MSIIAMKLIKKIYQKCKKRIAKRFSKIVKKNLKSKNPENGLKIRQKHRHRFKKSPAI